MKDCILQVEDDENDILLFQHACQAAGFSPEIKVALDGQAAIDYLSGSGKFADRKLFPLPRIVLLDLKMPRKDGFEVLQWIRHHPAVKWLVVIMFTSSAQPRDVNAAYRLGVNSFTVKPSSVDERVMFARALNDWWYHFNVLPNEVPLPSPHAQPSNAP